MYTVLHACTYPDYLDEANGTNGDYLLIGARYADGTYTNGNVTYVVCAGDSLWKIAKRELGSGSKWGGHIRGQ